MSAHLVVVIFCSLLRGCLSVQDVSAIKKDIIVLPDSAHHTFSLQGIWSFRREGIDSTAHSIRVPANWFTERIDEQKIDFAGKAEYCYDFTIPEHLPTSLLTLVFEGVDYQADVWLNDVRLGTHAGYFAPFSFPIHHIIRTDRPNRLRVLVNSPLETQDDWSLTKRLIKGIFGHHDTRPGGAWSKRGQEQNTGGIWGKVYIQAGSIAHIQGLKCNTIIRSDTNNATKKTVFLRLQASIWAAKEAKVLLQYSLRAANFLDSFRQIPSNLNLNLQRGDNLVDTIIRIENAQLWYPADVGFPHLYTLKSSLSALSSDGTPSAVDTRFDKIGLRTVQCDSATQQLFINGRRLFLRGTNYIGTQWLSTMGKAEYRRDVQLMQEANINAIRVHAHIARKDFYDVCDEAGILVWQDFPLQWGYSDDADFFREAHRQTGEMIDALYNHPSIFAWCMHNEPPFDADWMTYKYKDYYPTQNKRLNEVLTKTARKLDSTRYVHPFSATKEHHWQGWYGGQWTDHAKPTKTRIISEFGAQALPERSTLVEIVGEKALFPKSEEEWAVWDFHNFQRMETFQNAKIPMGATTEEFIANTQRYQTRLTQLAVESYRRQKYAPVSSIFQFMFVENWASINWGIVDFQRKPKPAYFALQQAYKPTTAFHTYDTATQRVQIWVVNDRWKPFSKCTVSCALEPMQALMPAPSSKPYGIPRGMPLPMPQVWQCSIPADTAYILASWQLPLSVAQRLTKSELRLQTTLSY